MFYSQFILAKKGPLGTIWIAAHLERKLRKNQVADTDIGVSVDSILFPDVPIALRLSSHLLLGVVRIYSKKVNYLFHDCSETMLKIKQAFRSTAVDLPPEESTAPYHSITLPETFDLDDFELPDNGLFEGNFVDHHISSREQITLQDTLNGMSYSTSQFGPDERFGDGDASQLGLDIDESLFADKIQTPMDITDNLALEEHDGESFLAAPATTLSEMDIDGPLVHDDMENNSVLTDPNDPLLMEPNEAERNGVEATCPVRSPSSELAQAPSTPGLLQEAISATYHDGPTLSPQRKLSPSNVVEGVGCDDGEISHLGDDPDMRKCENDLSNLLPESVSCADQNDVRHDNNLVESEKGIQNNVEENSEFLENSNKGSDTKNLPLDNEEHPEDLRQELDDGPPKFVTRVIDSAVWSTNDGDIAEGMEGGNSPCHMLIPCSSGLKETDVPHRGDDELARAFDSDNVPMDKEEEPKCSATETNSNLESTHPGESTINADLDKLDDTVKDNHLETLVCETNSSIQLPESFVSAPSALETPNVLVPLHEVEITTETEKDDESLVPMSGKKRKVMETTPILGNGDLANLSELPRSKKSADFIPDDDDVLASILVGRKTPSLKLKPTPMQEGATVSKRSRINSRVSQSKRKVLVDDAMVMHGDVIRQQLTHTEDIRRVRRKAPCSQIEIWMIENSHLEEEMFTEPLFSGVSSELCSVVSQIYKVIETEVLKSGETTLEACVQQDVSLVGISDRNNGMAQEPSVLSSHTEKQDCNGDPLTLSTQEGRIGVTDSFALSENENGLSLNLTGVAIDVQDLGNADNAVCVDPEMDNILDPLNREVLAEMPEVVTDLDVEKIEARADVVHNSEEEKTECAAHVDEPMNDVSIVIDEKVAVLYDGRELSLVQEVCNGGISVDTSSVVDVPKDVGNENDHTQRVPMEVDLPENLVNVEETFKESEPPTLSCPNQCEMDSGMESLDKGESQIQEVEKDVMDGQNPADTLTNNLSPPFEEIHTEFLNLDDEAEPEPVEEEDNYASTEQDRFFENSGWSSRTRAVARYLKSLFDNEDGRGRKVVAVDNLLAGKTRKEASRMFFETLVLKTKDYIQVQQDNSFGNISIKPRGKLVKSDF